MPFAMDEFLSALEIYNAAIWPVQVAAHLVGILAIFLAFFKMKAAVRTVSVMVAALWIWTGAIFFLRDFSSLSRMAIWFGLAFLLQGILILFQGAVKGDIRFIPRFDRYGVAGAAFMVYALIGYPLASYLIGHSYPREPMFGVTPGSLVMFTFGLLLWADEGLPKFLMTIPFVWSLIGSVISPTTGLYEDLPLMVFGLVGSLMVLKRERALTEERLKAATSTLGRIGSES
jgi:hypothetical protein